MTAAMSSSFDIPDRLKEEVVYPRILEAQIRKQIVEQAHIIERRGLEPGSSLHLNRIRIDPLRVDRFIVSGPSWEPDGGCW